MRPWARRARGQDPREYLTFLNQLQAMPEARQRFTIDDLLKRHDRALAHLLQDASPEAYAECLAYTDRHSLHGALLQLVRHDATRAPVRFQRAQPTAPGRREEGGGPSVTSGHAQGWLESCTLTAAPVRPTRCDTGPSTSTRRPGRCLVPIY